MLRCPTARAAQFAMTTTTAATVVAVRTYVTAKGRCEYRLDYSHSTKRGPQALRDIKEGEAKLALKDPANKKEAMAHLLERPKYEYVTSFQRAADDMMAIQSDPRKFCDDMSYHYHRVGKCFNGSTTWANEGNSSCGQFNKLTPPN